MLRFLLSAAALLLAAALSAAPRLVADLNRGQNTEVQNVWLNSGDSSSPVLYFAASDPAHGLELWRSDGTSDGTWRLTDVCPGRCDASPGPVTVFEGRLFFTADDGVSGVELWESDGTPGSERRVRDLCPGPCGIEIESFQALGDRLLFTATIQGKPALWRTDGTRNHTFRLQDLPSSFWFEGDQPLGGSLYFTVAQGDTVELWRTDGTIAGTRPLSVLIPGFPAVVSSLSFLGDVILFWSQDGLWRTDGTAAGTWSLSARIPGLPLTPSGVTLFAGAAFVWSQDALWRTDGTAAGTVRVKRVADLLADPLPADVSPFLIGVWNGALYSFAGQSLVRSDGTAAGTAVVALFSAEEKFAGAIPLSAALLLEFGRPYYAPSILWETQGTPQTTKRVADLTDRGYIAEMSSLGDRAVFRLLTESYPGNLDTWVSDGTPAGTRKIAPHTGSYPLGLTVAGGQVFFVNGGNYTHQDLWRTDGTAAGTHSVHDFSAGPAGAGPLSQAVAGGKLVFSAQTGPIDAPLFASDGTAAGTSLLSEDISWASGFTQAGGWLFTPTATRIGYGSDYPPALMSKGLGVIDGHGATEVATPLDGFRPSGALGNQLLFGARFGSTFFNRIDVELWRSDGTRHGTVNVENLDPKEITTNLHHTCVGESSSPGPGVVVVGRLVFAANDGKHGRELWSSDGTVAGTRIVRDINPARIPNQPDFDGCDVRTEIGLASNPDSLVAFHGGVLFAAEDQPAGRELWWSDGTWQGTRRVKDLVPGPQGSAPRELTLFRDAIYFFATSPTGGDALWRSDGTRPGTVLVDDLTVGGTPSWARSLTAAGDHLFFSVYNEATGAELWASQGTAASTVLVADLRPGRAGSSPQQLTALGNVLVFAATDGVHGLEPWRSDGTAAGTRPLGDIRPGLDASAPGPFSRVGGSVLFGADDGVHGRELWAVPVSDILRP
jgi:ELWxxDGT repeat protein